MNSYKKHHKNPQRTLAKGKNKFIVGKPAKRTPPMKNLIKIIASLTALTLMTACAGGVTINPVVNNGTTTDCKTNAFHADCLTDTDAIELRQDMCLADATTNPLCTGEAGIVTVFCTANPFDTNCIDEIAYDVVRTPLCVADKTTNDCTSTIVRVCTDDPFGDLCVDDSNYNDARFTACSADATTRALIKCAPTVIRICPHDPFSTFCADDPNYNDRRRMSCLPDPTAGVCGPTTARICTADPFDVFCAGANYNPSRRTICLTETTSMRCMPTVDLFCTPNPYDDVCTGTTYAESRSVANSRSTYDTRGCVNLIGDGPCVALLRFLCTETPLDAFCDSQIQYRPARRTLCLKETADPVACATTVMQVCSANSLDTLCEEEQDYFSLQESACNGESAISKPECTATLTRVCGNLEGTSATGDPFNGVCRNSAFQPARNAIISGCTTQTDGRLCQAVRDDTCANTPFDLVCKGAVAYLPAQIRACIGQPATGNCADASFFTDSVILGCLADPFDVACTMSGSTFAPYVSVAQDATCLASGVLANCANPTAVFGTTLPSSLLALRVDPAQPHHISTNRYLSGFITIDADDLDGNGNLIPPGVEGSNFEFPTTDSGNGATTHNGLGLPVNAGAAGDEFPDAIPGGAVTMRRGGAGSTNDDGVAYFATIDASGDDALSYGGILPTTNLGAPLLPQPVAEGADNITAIWVGHVSYRQNPNVQNSPVNFWVDFTAGTINFANTAGTDGTGKVNAPIGTSGTNLILSGKFGATHNLAPGQLGGTVGYYFGRVSVAQPQTNSGDFTVHGLIGQEGAVAVFIQTEILSNGHPDYNGRLGGFTASNPDHPNN